MNLVHETENRTTGLVRSEIKEKEVNTTSVLGVSSLRFSCVAAYTAIVTAGAIAVDRALKTLTPTIIDR